MKVIKRIRQATVLAVVVAGGIGFAKHPDFISNGFSTTDRSDVVDDSDKSTAEKIEENTTTHSSKESDITTTSLKTAGPTPIGPLLPSTTTTIQSNIRNITVTVSGTNCVFIDDATGEQVHSLEEGEVVNLSTNQNGAGFVGVDGDNMANEYTLAVKLSTSKEPVQLKFGTSIAAQCQDAADYQKLTGEPHQATTDEGKATIPVTEFASQTMLNGENFNSEAFAKTDIGTHLQAEAIVIPGIEAPGLTG